MFLALDGTRTWNKEYFSTFKKVFGSRAVKGFGERFALALILGELDCHAVAYSNTQNTPKKSIFHKRKGSFPPFPLSADYAKTWSHFCLSIFIPGPSSWWTVPGFNSSAPDDAGIQRPECKSDLNRSVHLQFLPESINTPYQFVLIPSLCNFSRPLMQIRPGSKQAVSDPEGWYGAGHHCSQAMHFSALFVHGVTLKKWQATTITTSSGLIIVAFVLFLPV